MGVIAASQLPSDPLEGLREIARSETELDRLRRDYVRAARAASATWEQIGEALGMTRQSAWEQFSRDAWDATTAIARGNESLVGEDEALDLAVEEVRTVRRARRSR